MNQVDLHLHTTASDGLLSPAQVVARAAKTAVRTIAITDHDTTAGVDEALRAGIAHGIEVIPGVEINTDVPGAEVHVLGYHLTHADPTLNESLTRLRDGRIGRARRMAEVLTEMGAPVSFARILQIAGDGAMGRPHVAQALLEAGHVRTYGEAFERYIGRNSPAYVERLKFSPVEACSMIRAAGGVAVLAHPVFYDRFGAIKSAVDLDVMLPMLSEAGLAGLEVYYPGYDAITVERLLGLCRKFNLVATGGTDFHGLRFSEPGIGGIYVPQKAVRRLREAWEQARR